MATSLLKKNAASTYVSISLHDFEKFLYRGYRALSPKKYESRGEIVFDLQLSDFVFVRVYSSLRRDSGMGAGVGGDAIRVGLVDLQGRPLMAGKMSRVYRTTNWTDNLRKLIDEMMETYEDRTEYWDGRAQGRLPTIPILKGYRRGIS